VAKVNGVGVSSTPSAGKILTATSATAADWEAVELGYDEITATVGVTGLTEGTATTVITCAPHTFNGRPVLATFCASAVETPTNATGDAIRIGLFEGGTLVNRFGSLFTPAAAKLVIPFFGAFRFTPTAAAHSYVVAAWVNTVAAGTPGVDCGTGGAGNLPPAWVRFTEA
jgi:hypothetical protein